ncbi:glycosyltransferase family 2 protein [Asanoa sp. WMMD1127]|uniref:glycosyltransferase family 2 protein n=1 Tax=Asanoa sp. WMMD1127 TaxID=3016107 RepID=UPI0024174806|nr:glycosyltransferase family 2 protein [Asanoa sp. WMMD1127]MDG4823210.1 glycosyltransferase family 2 protein [Asanoa sp. WMMD1127]
MHAIPRVVRNDWSTVAVPELAGWRPSRSVSVIIPAYRCQATLDLTLASLSRQTYPAELLEVVVVDDGSEPALELPAIRPARTTLVRVESGWGRANALHTGVRHSTGEILHWLDADMVVYPEHVAAQARWQHVLPYAVTLGYKRFVDPETHGPWPAAETVDAIWRAGEPDELFGGAAGEPHSYVERYITQTDQLRTADHLAFRIHVGATAALRRELYEAAGGFDTDLRLGEDTEFGYRLAQAGAVFVPEPAARAWHLGRTQVMRAREQVARYNQAFFADRIPYPRHSRKVGGTVWTVPLAEVVVPVGDEPLEHVRAATDAVLRGTDLDVRVNLLGPWDKLDDTRVSPLADPHLDLRLIAATYRGEPRVRLVTEPPDPFPAPFLLELPPAHQLAPDSLRHLVELADHHQVGLVRVGTAEPVLLWRTAALRRAELVRAPDESRCDAVTAVFGSRTETPAAVGIAAPTGRRKRPMQSTVEVGGVRSLARATVMVGWLTSRQLKARLIRRR